MRLSYGAQQSTMRDLGRLRDALRHKPSIVGFQIRKGHHALPQGRRTSLNVLNDLTVTPIAELGLE